MGHVGSLVYSPLNVLSMCKHGLWQCGPHCAALTGSTFKHLTMGCGSRGHHMGLGGIWHVQLGPGRLIWRGNTLTGDLFTHSSCRMVSANTNTRSEGEQNRK